MRSRLFKIIIYLQVSIIFFPSLALGENFCVTSKLNGQLGNQCFQIATALSLAWDNGVQASFPDLIKEVHDGIPVNREQVFWRLSMSDFPLVNKYKEPYFHYSSIPYKKNIQLEGYFQSEKYFKHHKEKIINLFEAKPEIVYYLLEKYNKYLSAPETVSIHVRTYSKENPTHSFYCLNGRKYVKRAMKFFSKDVTFLVFSDDINWAKKNLKGLAKNMYFIEGEKYYYDFFLMSLCDHNIISNSSFSWWAAYLNRNPNKIVIAPKKWFHEKLGMNISDLIPPEWIRVK